MEKENKTLATFIVLLLITSSLPAQNPTFEWANHIGGTGIDLVNHITTDVEGNVIVTGVFMDTVDFDPGSGVTNLVSTATGFGDVFIQKLDAKGNLLWVKKMGGIRNDYGFSSICDLQGNVYTTGSFQETVDFDPGPEVNNLSSVGRSDVFVQKLDTDGNFLWVKQMGGKYDDTGYDITIDVDGNIITTGHFQKTIDFDPGLGVTNLTSEGKLDVFVQKLDADGNFMWAKSMGGIDDDKGYSVTSDVDGNVYTTGFFNKRVDFNPGESTFYLQAHYAEDIYIQKLDADGNFIWAKSMGGIGTDMGHSIVIDPTGNIYTTGFFEETVDFDPGTGVVSLTSEGDADIYVQKLDSDGNLLWAKHMGGPKNEVGNTVNTDADGNVYTSGSFQKTVDFDPGAGAVNLTSNGSTDMFIQKMDANGSFQWVKQMGGAGTEYLYSTAIDALGNIYSTGVFNNTINLDPDGGSATFTPAGWSDVFVQKLSVTPTNVSETSAADNPFVYPNPASSTIHLRNQNALGEFRIYNVQGKLMHFERIDQLNQSIDISPLNPGLYIWQIGGMQGKLMVQ